MAADCVNRLIRQYMFSMPCLITSPTRGENYISNIGADIDPSLNVIGRKRSRSIPRIFMTYSFDSNETACLGSLETNFYFYWKRFEKGKRTIA